MSNNTFTGYAAASFVNEVLKKNDIDFAIKPQMVYNYMKKGYIASNDGLIEHEVLVEWTKKYVAKKIAKVDESTVKF